MKLFAHGIVCTGRSFHASPRSEGSARLRPIAQAGAKFAFFAKCRSVKL
jgi:hypothetical protein